MATIPDNELAKLAAAAAGLFSRDIRTAVVSVGDPASHRAIEATAIIGAAQVRREEFLAGRASARRALAALGEADVPIGVGPAGEPVWPSGIVGSITHTRTVAAAAVARARDAWGVGLDAETLETTLDADTRALAFTSDETARLTVIELTDPAAALVLFSAKESVYKCLFPRTGWRLSFHDVDIQLDLQDHRFAARITAPSEPGSALEPLCLDGAFAVVAGHVLTGITL